jgi:DUF4097 and DUF4098 domain-containing protein YvlB
MRTKKIWSFCIVVVLFIAVQAFGITEGDLKRSFSVGKGGTLTLETDIGSIDIQTHDKDRVDINIEFKKKTSNRRKYERFLDDFDVSFQQDGNDVTVDAEYDRDFWNSIGRTVQVRFELTVPKRYHLDLATAGGSISVSDLEGKVDASTSGGNLDFGEINGPVVGRTSGGSVSVKACRGRVDVKTSGGSIHLGEVEGNVYARTSGGSIQVDEVKGAIDAATSGGPVSAVISEQPREDCQLKTSGGGITISMAEGIQIDFDAKTSGGRIKTDFPLTVQGEISSNMIRGKVNGGGPLLYVRTSGGSINLNRME